MATCGTSSALTIKGLDAVSTPPGARTWLAPRGQTLTYNAGNTFDTVPKPVLHDYKIEYRRNS